jgi:hypothetical protein
MYGGAASVIALKVTVSFNYEAIPNNASNSYYDTTGPTTPMASAERGAAWGQWLKDKITPVFGVIGDITTKSQDLINNVARNDQRILQTAGVTTRLIRDASQIYGAYKTYQNLNNRQQAARLLEL